MNYKYIFNNKIKKSDEKSYTWTLHEGWHHCFVNNSTQHHTNTQPPEMADAVPFVRETTQPHERML